MKRLTILVDADDTIENLSEAWVHALNEKFGTSVLKSDVTDWDFTKFFPGLTHEQVYGVLFEEELWKSVKPLQGAVKYLSKLVDDGNDVYIVTASHPNTVSMKFNNVFLKYFPFIEPEKIIIASNKQMISGDFLIDDAPHNMGGKYMGLLFTANHNVKVTDEELVKMNAVRVDNWKEVYGIIHGYQENTK